MKVSSEFRVQHFMDMNIIIPIEHRSWNPEALLILSDRALFAYEKLSKGAEREEMVSALQEYFGITEREAKRDIRLLMMKLARHNLLE